MQEEHFNMQDGSIMNANKEDSLDNIFEMIQMKVISAQTLDFTPPWDFRISDAMASFYMILNGRCRLRMDDSEDSIDMSCGDVAVLLDKKVHRLQNTIQCRRRLLDDGHAGYTEKIAALRTTLIRGVFTWGVNDIASFLPELPPTIHIKCNEGRLLPWMSRTIMMMADESGWNRPGIRAVINHLANDIFIQGLRAHLAANGGAGQAPALINHRQISPALYLMNTRPEEAWPLSTLARKCAMSRSAFAEKFKQAVGQSPMTYLLKIRMDKACDLLSQNILEIKEISEQTGYQSQSSFSNAFKQWTGVSPGSYRKSRQNWQEEAQTC
jgi:AraC-like DNA-binding protein